MFRTLLGHLQALWEIDPRAICISMHCGIPNAYRLYYRNVKYMSLYILGYVTVLALLTCSMVQSPSWEANWFAASQEIPRISRNPNVHYRTQKRPPPVPILGQPNQVHIPTSHLLQIHPNIIHPSIPRSPQWYLSLRFPHQDPIRPLSSPHARHMPCLSHSSRFYHPHNNINSFRLPVLDRVWFLYSCHGVHNRYCDVLWKFSVRSFTVEDAYVRMKLYEN